MPKTIAVTAVAATIAALAIAGAPATASNELAHGSAFTQTLILQLQPGHAMSRCTRPVSATAVISASAHIRRYTLATGAIRPHSVYLDGDGTLVQITDQAQSAPVCVRAVSWNQAEVLRVVISAA